jgi:hypothetical protein
MTRKQRALHVWIWPVIAVALTVCDYLALEARTQVETAKRIASDSQAH